MSVRELAAKSRRSPSHISRLERGEAGASEATLRAIATALRVPVAAINKEEAA